MISALAAAAFGQPPKSPAQPAAIVEMAAPHGHSLYQQRAHCVFVMWNPKLLPEARRVSEPVQLIDVMPTALDLLHLKAPDVVQCQSLVSLPDGFVPENRINPFALIEPNRKLIYREKGKDVGLNRVELYDRRTDRTVQNNIAAAHPQDVEHMMAELGKWLDAQKQIRGVLGKGARSVLDQQTLDQLRSLGYIGRKQ